MPKNYYQNERKTPTNKQTKYFFIALNEFVNFSEYIWIFQNFLTVLKKPSKKIKGYNRKIVFPIIRKIFKFNMEPFYKTTSKMSNARFVHFSTFWKKFKNGIKILKKFVWIPNNQFVWNTKKDRGPDYLLANFSFYQFFYDFSTLLLCKVNFLNIFNIHDFFQILVKSRSIEILIELNIPPQRIN